MVQARDLGRKFAAALYAEYRFSMSVSEIETAFRQLSIAEQEELLLHLEHTLRRRRDTGVPESREEWMRRLHELRASIGSGTSKLSSEQILEELRED